MWKCCEWRNWKAAGSNLELKAVILTDIFPILALYKDKEKNQCIKQKTGAQNIVKEVKQYQKKWLQHVQRMDTEYQNKYYNINQKDEGTQDDLGRDGGTNFILRIKEQETRLTLQERDDDDDDDFT